MTDNLENTFIHSKTITPRTYDIDAHHHVNNIVYVRWMEDLRVELLSAYLPFAEIMERKVAPIILETNIRYKKAIHLFEKVDAVIRVLEMKKARFTLGFEFKVGDKIAAEAWQKGAWINTETGRPVPPPPELSDHFDEKQE